MPCSVIIHVGQELLPTTTAHLHLPGIEFIPVFDLVHTGILGWSPNIVAALNGPVAGRCAP